jgi:hypothetical protein
MKYLLGVLALLATNAIVAPVCRAECGDIQDNDIEVRWERDGFYVKVWNRQLASGLAVRIEKERGAAVKEAGEIPDVPTFGDSGMIGPIPTYRLPVIVTVMPVTGNDRYKCWQRLIRVEDKGKGAGIGINASKTGGVRGQVKMANKVLGDGFQASLGYKVELDGKGVEKSVDTDNYGNFEFKDIPAGTYSLRASPQDSRNMNYRGQTTVTVEPGRMKSANIMVK